MCCFDVEIINLCLIEASLVDLKLEVVGELWNYGEIGDLGN